MRAYKSILVIVMISAMSQAHGQTTRHVDGGNACPGTGSLGDPFCLIQAGIEAAVGGDEVVVQPGTYLEAIDFDGKAITVRSASGDPTDTIIDGTGSFHVVQCVNGEGADTVLSGFTITGGNATGAGFPDTDDRGGGMYNDGSSPTVINCVFSGNTADIGGGMFNDDNSNPIVTDCSFVGNQATNPLLVGGGGMFNLNSSPTLTNCAFSGNSAEVGAAIYNNGSFLTATNCTFSGNTAAFGGGAMLNNFSSPTITNCILWGNATNELSNSNGGVPMVTFSNIQGGFEGTGNVNADPLFVDADGADDIVGTPDDDLRLQSCLSPCFNRGDNAAIPAGTTTDLDGNPRLSNLTVDMGAYELPDDGSPDDDGDGFPNDCDQCPDDSKKTEPAVCGCGVADTDSDGDLVADCVDLCPGTKSVPVDSDGCPLGIINISTSVAYDTIQMAIDDALDGQEIVCQPGTYFEAIDFLGKAITLRSASGDPSDTRIAGSGNQSVVRCASGEEHDTVLSGFTITGGSGAPCPAPFEVFTCGGGIFIVNSSPTAINCIFSGNGAEIGGGMYNENASPTVSNCTFSSNVAVSTQGKSSSGGAMYNVESSPRVTNCAFLGNSADLGAGMSNVFSGPMVAGCTFSGNTGNVGVGMYNNQSNPTVMNCIFWGNLPDEINSAQFSAATISYSDVSGGLSPGALDGGGNIDADPQFVDANGLDNIFGTADDDARLMGGSPCIDAGNSLSVPLVFPTDLDNHARIVDDPDTPNTGVGFPEVVDMGAYEFASSPPCRKDLGDFNCDGVVDLADFAFFMRLFTGCFK